MIISPSISQILRGVIHEMSTSLKEGLDDPVKQAQIDTIVGVLGAAAVRAEDQQDMVAEECAAILETAQAFVQRGQASSALEAELAAYDADASETQRYNQVSRVLCAMADLGSGAGPELTLQVRELMTQRLENESKIIGGGFEAAGRG